MRDERMLYYGKKLVIFIISVGLLSLVTFYVSRLAPGDPLFSYYGERVEKMSPEEREWAKAKGIKKSRIMLLHCMRNIMPSYLSIMAISVTHIMGGTYMAETVFSYPGIGTLAYESARYKDYNLLMIISLMSGIIIIACNMTAQILNERIDPRMRISRQSEMQQL